MYILSEIKSTEDGQPTATAVKNGIRSKKRVKDHGEVMTPENVVSDMLELIPQKAWASPKFPILEPSCGSGNFVVAAVKKRIDCLYPKVTKSKDLAIIWALNTTFAFDICKNNVKETQCRALSAVINELPTVKTEKSLDTMAKAIVIVEHNFLVVDDTLKSINEINELKFPLQTKGISKKAAEISTLTRKRIEEIKSKFTTAADMQAYGGNLKVYKLEKGE